MIKKLASVAAIAAVLATNVAPASAHIDKNPLTQGLSMIIGVPVGMLAGGLRGSTNKGVEYANSFSDSLGENILGQGVGHVGGVIVGGVTGGLTGIIRGAVDGITVSVDEPLTPASASLENDFQDWDPYELFN